jgi:hypothetical protein
MYTPRINWILLVLFGFSSIAIFVGALISPAFRMQAYAPLRELLIPPPEPITINLLYSTEKDGWLTEVLEEFEMNGPRIDSRPIKVEVEKMGSWEMYAAVLDGTRKPVLISPASLLQVSALQDAWSSRSTRPLVNPADNSSCRPVVKTPLTLVAWKERAGILWGGQPDQSLWLEIHDHLVDPSGWASHGRPEWGYIKFGHTDPLKSNSGFMTILLMTYGYFEKTANLSSNDILTDDAYQKWFLEIESVVGQFEHSTGPLMNKMISYGPSTYDFVAVYEATAIEQAENAVGRYGELRVYYPPTLVWSDHPFCVLDGDWVTSQQARAGRLLIDYLASQPVQKIALMKYGFRPTDPSIKLDQPGSPFDQFAANGFRSDLSNLPEVEIPAGSTLNTLRDFWSRNVSR